MLCKIFKIISLLGLIHFPIDGQEQPQLTGDEFKALSTNPDDINFYTYPDNSKANSHKIVLGDVGSLQGSGLVPGTTLTVIVHVHNTSWTTAPLNAYLKYSFKNILWVDWEKLATPRPSVPMGFDVIVYPAALENVPRTGRRTAEVISFLIKNKIISGPEMIHFVGWSTGAHIVATAARFLKSEFGRIPLRITALDPAGPLSFFLKKNRLSKDKASFVDVMHTSNLFLGTAQSLGHVDFFVNGGLAVKQPGCPPPTSYSALDLQVYFLCAHRLAATLFAKTINPETYIYGCPCIPIVSRQKASTCKKLQGCKEKVRMGEYTPIGTRGNYHVQVDTNPGPD